jgi:hypothetical protein
LPAADQLCRIYILYCFGCWRNDKVVLCRSRYSRLAPGQLEAELGAQSHSAPTIPFKPFSPAYVAKALATPTNWTALGAVTPVKNQGPHGYCGTFGRVGSAEGQFYMKTGKLVSFSEEELVDCVGWDRDQFTYFSPNGFMTTADYPYNLSAYKDQVCSRLKFNRWADRWLDRDTT